MSRVSHLFSCPRYASILPPLEPSTYGRRLSLMISTKFAVECTTLAMVLRPSIDGHQNVQQCQQVAECYKLKPSNPKTSRPCCGVSDRMPAYHNSLCTRASISSESAVAVPDCTPSSRVAVHAVPQVGYMIAPVSYCRESVLPLFLSRDSFLNLRVVTGPVYVSLPHKAIHRRSSSEHSPR